MPLHFAAQTGNFQILSILKDAGADVNCTDNDGVTPLMLLAQNGKTDAALQLLKFPEIDISIHARPSIMPPPPDSESW